MAQQLIEAGIEKVTVESTAGYWRIWYYLLGVAWLSGAAGQDPGCGECAGLEQD
ncbi:hypothetical protein ABFA25_02450 [Mycobacterium lepromatosis]|uniref:hypothetical protein n=1 Tax=Mycobacterium lepromatosis TaxID=480418 RepID=UPI0012E067C1